MTATCASCESTRRLFEVEVPRGRRTRTFHVCRDCKAKYWDGNSFARDAFMPPADGIFGLVVVGNARPR